MHPKDGTLRAYQDGQLSQSNQERLEEHLSTCPRCQARAARIEQHRGFVQARVALLGDTEPEGQTPPSQRLINIQDQLLRKEKEHMVHRPKWRPLWVGLSIIVALALAMSFPQVRAMANNFLGLFRVERVQVVPVDMSQTPENTLSETTLNNLENFFAQQVTFEGGSESVTVDTVAEASELAGFKVRLPDLIGEPVELRVQSGGRITFQIDVELANAVLTELGQREAHLPESMDQATVEITVPNSVFASFGTCYVFEAKPEGEYPPAEAIPLEALEDIDCITLIQIPSPTVTAPPELNLTQLGEAYLQVLGMTREEAQSYASRVDWTSTFVIPIPRYSAQYRDLEVDGVIGTYVKYQGELRYLLIWVRQGIIYALSGQGGAELAQDIANSMK